MSAWFEKHKATLDKALDACAKRYAWTAYQESPSSKIHGTQKPVDGKARFEALLNQPYPLEQPATIGTVGAETSPYTREALGIQYPKADVEALYPHILQAMPAWRNASTETRLGVCLEMLHRCSEQLFENAHATMHTSGQSYIMAFAGSGANALDRGLEALAYAAKAMADVPATARWERQFGSDGTAQLDKTYRLMPRGVSVAVCCATFPLWNGYPALCASLATGNPVVMKPHPSAILPVALMVSRCREVLSEAGFDPNLVTLVADTREEPATIPLLQHPETAIIDFTGSPTFGQWIENNCRNAQVYTETAGCNSVVIESSNDLPAMAKAIAHSLCQASAQMCTSVQNIHIPKNGVEINGKITSFDTISQAIVEAVDAHLASPKNAAFLCGTLVDDAIYQRLDRLEKIGAERGKILRSSSPYENPGFPDARTATPLIIELSNQDSDLYREELFGPISFIIKGDDADNCLSCASRDAKERGAITSHVYTVNEPFWQQAQEAFHLAGASVACNLTGMPINFAAAYSDYHVSGLNPAGNACLTDLAFVSHRFRIVQSKIMRP
jgi:phenylacetic acid degradation protein paaN